MMPISRRIRNAGVVVGVTMLCACTRTLGIDVELQQPEAPDPFEGVELLQVRALIGGDIVDLGTTRWDQGPVELQTEIDPEVDRLVVEGLTVDGDVVSSGASSALDLLRSPPEGPVRIYFSREAEVSITGLAGTPVVGARGYRLESGEVGFFGGTTDDGCPWTELEAFIEGDLTTRSDPFGGIVNARRLAPGGDANVLSFTGEAFTAGCMATSAPTIRQVDKTTGEWRSIVLPSEILAPGVSVAVVSPELAIVMGGNGNPVASTRVRSVSLETGTVEEIGTLSLPRAEATAQVVSGGRIALIGGRSQTSTASALANASVFVPERGATLAAPIPLVARAIQPVALGTRAGGIIVAGDQRGSDRIDVLVVKTEQDFQLGDTSTIARTETLVDSGEFIELVDGSALLVPASGSEVHHVELLPQRARRIELPAAVGQQSLAGVSLDDGRVLLRADDGRYLSLNFGAAAILGFAGFEGRLRLAAGEADVEKLGVVPLRPNAWSRTPDGLEGRFLGLAGGTVPQEFAVVSDTELVDFELEVTVGLRGLSRPAIVFGLVEDRFDYVLLSGVTSLERSPAGQDRGGKLSCNSAETRILSQPGFHRIIVTRRGSDVTVDVGGDDIIDIRCSTPRAEIGHVAFGVVNGQPLFDDIVLRR